ncbi:MAG: phosphatidylglycerophosphatase A [Methylobacillus sp.]|jgi:phosphatidylglycerophosphatase A|nr:phosphatidylglycerophosphatase A [Methylobacillus sp.]
MTTSPDLRFLFRRPAHLLALGFGSGLSRIAPGTFGTLVAFPLFYGTMAIPSEWHLPLIAFLFLIGIPICGATGRALGVEDHGGIVWDEIVAMLLVLEYTPFSWTWWLAAFALFRFFDILKPFPIRRCERRFKGGFGVMFDDLLAAIYALLILHTWLWLTTR